MTSVHRLVAVSLFVAASSVSLFGAQTRTFYRTYRMGDDQLTISRQIGVPSAPGTMPGSPGTVQDLRWRSQYARRGDARPGDPVARLVFSFYEDQLFRIVIDYASDRTEGMTEADMVAAVSHVYGPPAKRIGPDGAGGLAAPATRGHCDCRVDHRRASYFAAHNRWPGRLPDDRFVRSAEKPSRAQGARPMLQPTRKIGHRSMPAAYLRTGGAAAARRHAGRTSHRSSLESQAVSQIAPVFSSFRPFRTSSRPRGIYAIPPSPRKGCTYSVADTAVVGLERVIASIRRECLDVVKASSGPTCCCEREPVA